MCESYVEPFLFLITILMAVILNKGTNIIFPHVSHITNSIAAILQMALSMDYSIMLMNRYDQEKKTEKDKVEAMKKALHKSFQSISSSSVTTIVGLLSLVFMSFKIGKDLGFILAKGVLFSLICIFFVLPSLILMFDRWIVKTKKKSPKIKMDKIAKISYKLRYGSIPVFLLIFVFCFLFKGNLGIDYTDKQSDEISKVFAENNQIAIIYKNKEEETVSKYLEELENNPKVEEVLGYGNTINEKLTYDQVNDQLKDLGSDVTVDEYLLKIIYYHYYNQQETNKVTFEEFIDFIETEAYENPETNQQINEEIKRDITRLKNFVTESEIYKKRPMSEIAQILDIDENQAQDLLIYYLSKHTNREITMNEFISFMNKDVLTSTTYASKIDNKSKNQLNQLSKFMNRNTIEKKMTAEEMAEKFGMDSNTMKELFQYDALHQELDTKLSISDFVNFILEEVLQNPDLSSNFSLEVISKIQMLATFSNQDQITMEKNSNDLANLFGIEESMVKKVLLLKYLPSENTNEYRIAMVVNSLLLMKQQEELSPYLGDLDPSILEQIQTSELMKDNTPYSASEMATLLNISPEKMHQIYHLVDFVTNQTDSWVMTPQEFVTFVLEKEDIRNTLQEEDIEKLELLRTVINATIEQKTFTYQELSTIFGMDENSVKSIYVLFLSQNNSITRTPLEFVSFLLENKEDSMLSDSISNETWQELSIIKEGMTGVLENRKYNSNALSSLLGINQEEMKLLFGLYDSIYQDTNEEISLKDFVEFLLKDVAINKNDSNQLNEEKLSKLNTVDEIMNQSLNHTEYSKDEMFAILRNLSNNVEKNMIEVLYIYYGGSRDFHPNWQMTIEQFVNYLNEKILPDERLKDFIDEERKNNILDAKDMIKEAKNLLVGNTYSRIVLNTKFNQENQETFSFIQNIKDKWQKDVKEFYIIGDSPMAYEMSQTFNDELNLITIITMVAIFIVVALTFHSLIIPMILVLIIQCAVYLTMGILAFTGENVYFIALLIVQSILMGATIDYAILYTSYYLEHRKKLGIKESVIESYRRSIHTILTSSSILIIVTLIIASFTSAIAAKICKTISQGTLCSTILILVLLPAILSSCDKFLTKKK